METVETIENFVSFCKRLGLKSISMEFNSDGSVIKFIDKLTDKPSEKTCPAPQKPPEKPVERHVEKSVEKPAEKPAEKRAEKHADTMKVESAPVPADIYAAFCDAIDKDDGSEKYSKIRAELISKMKLEDLLRVNNDYAIGTDTDKPVEEIRKAIAEMF